MAYPDSNAENYANAAADVSKVGEALERAAADPSTYNMLVARDAINAMLAWIGMEADSAATMRERREIVGRQSHLASEARADLSELRAALDWDGVDENDVIGRFCEAQAEEEADAIDPRVEYGTHYDSYATRTGAE